MSRYARYRTLRGRRGKTTRVIRRGGEVGFFWYSHRLYDLLSLYVGGCESNALSSPLLLYPLCANNLSEILRAAFLDGVLLH